MNEIHINNREDQLKELNQHLYNLRIDNKYLFIESKTDPSREFVKMKNNNQKLKISGARNISKEIMRVVKNVYLDFDKLDFDKRFEIVQAYHGMYFDKLKNQVDGFLLEIL